MRSEKVTYCEKLMKDTNEIISRLDAKAIGGMVQWGDLRCVSVEWVESYTGNEVETVWCVVVEKASPRADEFRKSVSDGLAERGHFGIEVELNW
jgi:hypothetical protein